MVSAFLRSEVFVFQFEKYWSIEHRCVANCGGVDDCCCCGCCCCDCLVDEFIAAKIEVQSDVRVKTLQVKYDSIRGTCNVSVTSGSDSKQEK